MALEPQGGNKLQRKEIIMKNGNTQKSQPTVSKKTNGKDLLAQTIASIEQKMASKKHKRVIWTKKELETLKALVNNQQYSVKIIFEACAESGLFPDKSKGTIKAMAFAIRNNKEIPYVVVDDESK